MIVAAGERRSLGVSQFTTKPWTFEEDVRRLTRLFVDAIEIVEGKLCDRTFTDQIGEVRSAGLAISGVQPAVRTFYSSRMVPLPTAIEDRTARLRRSIERLGPLMPGVPFMVNTGAHPRGDMAETMARTVHELVGLSAVAEDHGVTIALEPLSPTAMNVETMIWTMDQAIEIIDRVGKASVGICLDLWNVWQDPALIDGIERAGTRILTAQFGDWRTPCSFADRVAPGDGVIAFADLIRAIERTGYRGPFVLELFSDDVKDSIFPCRIESSIAAARHQLDIR